MKTPIAVFIAAVLIQIPTGVLYSQESNPSTMLEKILPSVVTVAIHSTEDAQVFGFGSEDLVNQAYDRPLQLTNTTSSGSGFVIRRGNKLYIVTNAHVIDNASPAQGSISTYSIDHSKYVMKLVGADTFFDVAVLEFVDRPGPEIATVDFRSNDIRIGEKVYAIGNPLGNYPYSVSDGIIGGMNRISGGVTSKFGYLQSTAAIESGNSGGPLVDADGSVVGINTYGHYPFKYDMGQFVTSPQLNFSLDYRIAKKIVDEIISNGRIPRPYFGVALYQDYDLKSNYPLGSVYLGDVLKTSPNSGLLQGKTGYTINSINGQQVRNVDDALRIFESIRSGDTATITVSNNGQNQTLTLSSGLFDGESKKTLASYFLGKYTPFRPYESDQWIYFNADNSSSGEYRKHFIRDSYYNSAQKQYVEITDDRMLNPSSGGIFYFAGSANQDWSPRTIEQIGTIVRLSSLSGYVQIKTNENDTWFKHFVFLSGNSNSIRKVLYN